MYNRIVLIGRLTRDPELRYLPSGAPVAGFTLAVDRPFKNQAGERETDFVTITTWRKLAEQASRYLDKGRLVAVEGRLQIRSYEAQDGQRRKVAEVVADGIRFLDSGKRNGQRAAAVAEAQEQTAEAVPGEDDTREAPEAEEDVPFLTPRPGRLSSVAGDQVKRDAHWDRTHCVDALPPGPPSSIVRIPDAKWSQGWRH